MVYDLKSHLWMRRLPAFLTVALAYTSSSLLLGKITRNKVRRGLKLAKNLAITCRVGRKVLGLSVKLNDPEQTLSGSKNYLIVSNHLSYTDIVAMASEVPCVFVTSVEVQHSFFLGLMSDLGGSMFIERRNRNNIDNEIAMIAQALRDGLNVVIFPEGTSSDAQQVLPFKRSLLKAAIDAGVDVLPMCIKYVEINGRPITIEESEPLCYYGKKDFFPHLKYIFGLKSFSAEIYVLPTIPIKTVTDRKDISDRAYKMISEAYGGPKQHLVQIPDELSARSTNSAQEARSTSGA